MKSSLCLSGLPVDVLNCFANMKSFIDENNIDVFIHVWWRKEWGNGETFVGKNNSFRPSIPFHKDTIQHINQYNPLKIEIEDDRDYNDYIQKTYYDDPEFVWKGSEIDRMYKQLISLQRCNNLKCLYEKENNFEYKGNARSRFDFYLKKSIQISELDLNYMHFFNIKWNAVGDKNWVDDTFIIGNKKNMDMLSNIVDYIKEHAKLQPAFTGQNGLIAYYLMANNIEYKNSFKYGEDGALYREK